MSGGTERLAFETVGSGPWTSQSLFTIIKIGSNLRLKYIRGNVVFKYLRLCCGVGAFLSTFGMGHAENPNGGLKAINPDVLISDLKNLGASSTEVVSSESCMVKIEFNQYEVAQNIPTFKALGFISNKLSESYYTSHLNTSLVVLSFEVASYRTLAFFNQHKNIKKCEFVEYGIKTDDFGNDIKQRLFSYGFTRTIYAKIEWDNFITSNLPKVSEHFVLFDPMKALIAKAAAENES